MGKTTESVLGTSIMVALAICPLAAHSFPTFDAYPSGEIYTENVAPINFSSHPKAPMYRTRLINAAKEKPNFAGHYILTKWGCGSSCLMFAILDVKTGRVHIPDFAIFNMASKEALSYRSNSTLLIIQGAVGGDSLAGPFYYQ